MLFIRRKNKKESWYNCAMRYARKEGLTYEVRTLYRECVDEGMFPSEAAWCACYEWDISDISDLRRQVNA